MAKKAAPKAGSGKAATKAEIYTALAEKTKMSKKDVATVFDALGDLVKHHVGKKGTGMFVIPGLIKIKRIHKPATKAKAGVNPFTKQPMMIKAKPARNVVKAMPLKALKDSV